MNSTNILNPYDDKRFIGYVSLVSPSLTKIHFPSSILLKNFFHADEGMHALVGRYVIIEGSGNGFLGKITEISLPEKERLELTENRFEREAFHPTGRIEILLCFDNYKLKAKKGLDQLPPVSAKVFLCSNRFLNALLSEFGKKDNDESHVNIPLGNLPGDETHQIDISGQALFGRHCAILGTTGGGKSWTVAKLLEQVIENNGKAVLLDATGEYESLKGENTGYYKFNSLESDGVYFSYRDLRETDLYALFRPSQQSQLPKLQEAFKSLRLIEIISKKTYSEGDNESLFREEVLVKNIEHGYTTLKKRGVTLDLKFIGVCKNNVSVYSEKCDFDIGALSAQILSECIFENGNADQTAKNNCQSLISRILLTTNDSSFINVFDFKNENATAVNKSLKEVFDSFMKSKQNVLILSVADVSSERKLREILVNSIGRFLLEEALSKRFRIPGESLLLFLDEAHLFLNKQIKDEYSIEVTLDAFERIAKECRKHGLFLVLSTQMPRDIPRGVLSQVGTFIVHRLINQQDRETIEFACSEASKSALSFLPILSAGEAMLTGVDFPMPMILKIKEPGVKPNSETPKVFFLSSSKTIKGKKYD